MTSKAGSTISNFKMVQMFGYKGPSEKIQQEDVISKISFNQNGQYLALGDHAGRVIIFQSPQSQKKTQVLDYYAQFQSHSRQFDPLKSQQVSETITDLFWLRGQGKYQKIVTTNQKNIKLWKLFQKSYKKVVKSSSKQCNIPKLQSIQNSLEAINHITFPNKHLTSIHKIKCSSNEQFMISNDDVQAYLWNMQKIQKPYIIADYLKDKNLEDVKENLTCNSIHPTSDSIFLLATDKGSLKMCDLRLNSNFNEALSFNSEKVANKNFFSEMISSYSSVQFFKKGKYIAARDYLNVKIWDAANSSRPLFTIPVQQSLKTKLCDLFQKDALDDKFQLSCSEEGNQILTGNYNNSFHVINSLNGDNCQYELNYKRSTVCKMISNTKPVALTKLDNLRKTTTCTFHPKKKLLAVASLNCFFIYSI